MAAAPEMRHLLTMVSIALVACAPSPGAPDGGSDRIDAGERDAGSADAGSADAGPETDTDGGLVLRLAPESLQFFGLPINSTRFAVSGHDPLRRACATLIWDYSNNGMDPGAHCGDFFPGFPYVLVDADTDGPCGRWDYGTDLVTEAASGCVDFAGSSAASVDFVEASVRVRGTAFTGTVVADGRERAPGAVVLGIEYASDVPGDVWVQSGDEFGLPAWVTVRHGADPILLFDRCDVPVCGSGGGVCGAALPRVRSVTHGRASGGVFLVWDGRVRREDPSGNCRRREAAPAGAYTARFCFGYRFTGTEGVGTVENPVCRDVEFTLPAERVVWHVDDGG